MYWNFALYLSALILSFDKLQHEMYWNNKMFTLYSGYLRINYNMRCIETRSNKRSFDFEMDKLQHEMYWNT